MKLDPEIAQSLQLVQSRSIDFDLSTPEKVAATRASVDSLRDLWKDSIDRSGAVTEMHDLPGAPGGPGLKLRVHRPVKPAEKGALPCLFHVHGGGMVSGSVLNDDAVLLPRVRALGAIATSITYRFGPEHQSPAGAIDCCAGLQWLHDHASELGIDPARIALGGTSGGGGIAATTAVMNRDRGGPPLVLQQLICPMLDDRNDSVSARGSWVNWTREINIEAWRAVLGDRYGTDRVTGHDSVLREKNLTGLPPAYIDVGGMEVFRDECVEYAARLLRAGVQTELHVIPGGFHGFHLFAPQSRAAKLVLAAQNDALRRAWWPQGQA